MNAPTPTPTPLRPLMLALSVAVCFALPACARDAEAPAPAAAAAPAAPASVATAAPAATGDAPGELTVAKGVTPEAKAVLDRMSGYMRGLTAFSIESRTSRDEVMPSGYKVQRNEQQTLLVQRPNHLRSTTSGDFGDRTFVYDGTNMVLYSAEHNAYATVPAPDNIGKLVEGVLAAGIELPMIDVLYQAFDKTLTAEATHGIVVGDGIVDGVNCDHLAFRQSNADWQLWVAKGDQPLPRKIVITTRDTSDPQFESTLSWNLKPAVNAGAFAFVPPKGAESIPFAQPDALVSTTK
jgi:hypothetical protein